VGIVQGNDKTLVELGNVLGSTDMQLCLAGILLVGSLLFHDIKGAILIGIAVLTMVDWTLHNAWPTQVFQVPELHANPYWVPLAVFDPSMASVYLPALGAFVLICIFDISGVIFGLATLGGIMQPNGEIPGSLWAFIASGTGTLIAAWTGSTPIIVCVETAAGVREGGRTGLTAVFIGLYFTASLFFAPLFASVPELATAPVLVLVGVMMMGESGKIQWDNMKDAVPAFLTIILMPLTYSITNGMIFGLLAAAGFYITTGQIYTDTTKKLRARRTTTETDGLLGGDQSNGIDDDDDSYQGDPMAGMITSVRLGSYGTLDT
jgi:AGZA family xanthine/uracil permease-like MFS transporter